MSLATKWISAVVACVNFLRVKGKRAYKRRQFIYYAKIGEALELEGTSNCKAEKPGRIWIGNNCRICGTLEVQGDGEIRIGDNTCIYHHSIVGSVDRITIGSCVIISNRVHIYDNNNHPTSPRLRREMCRNGFDGETWRWTHAACAPIVIEDNVWIGEYATILKGVTIGTGAIVASHAVVTKNVPPYTIVAGNPARVVKEIENDEI